MVLGWKDDSILLRHATSRHARVVHRPSIQSHKNRDARRLLLRSYVVCSNVASSTIALLGPGLALLYAEAELRAGVGVG